MSNKPPHSLFKRLFVRVTLVLFITMSLGVLGSWVETHNEVNELFDREMARTAHIYEALLNTYVDEVGLDHLQQNSLFSRWLKNYLMRERDPSGERLRNYGKDIEFQLLDRTGHLLLRSPSAPDKAWGPLRSGFYNVNSDIKGGGWRLYVSFNIQTQRWFILANNYKLRDHLISALLAQLGWPIALTMILLLIFIPFTLRRELFPLKALKNAIAKRDSNNLEPFTIDNPPLELNEIVSALNELLARVDAARVREQRFTSEAAHELRTPLSVLTLHVQAIQKATSLREVRVSEQQLVSAIERARRMVQQLLHLSRAESEQHQYNWQPVQLMPLLRELIAELAPLAFARNQELSLFGGEGELKLIGQPELLRIIFSNLVDNAMRYTPVHGQIEIRVDSDPTFILVTVVDTGPGVNKEQQRRLFDRFYRADTGRGDGAGLGLAIVAALIKRHHGNVKVENREEGTGLLVKVCLPRIQAN